LMEARMRIGVIGGGSFGTALAKLLAELDHEVIVWFHNPAVARAVAAERENKPYLPGFPLPPSLQVTTSMKEAVARRELVLAACPSHVMREVMSQARVHLDGLPYVVSAAKGVEEGSLKRMSEVL